MIKWLLFAIILVIMLSYMSGSDTKTETVIKKEKDTIFMRDRNKFTSPYYYTSPPTN